MDSQSITLSIGCAAAMGEDLLGEKMETTGGDDILAVGEGSHAK